MNEILPNDRYFYVKLFVKTCEKDFNGQKRLYLLYAEMNGYFSGI